MAESQTDQERTESPSQRRRDEAKREGRVPRSQELSGSVILLAGMLTLGLAGGSRIAAHAVDLVRQNAGWLRAEPLSVAGASETLRAVAFSTLTAMAPFILAVTALGLGVNLVQARGVLSLEPLAPQWSRISPIAGIGRLFSVESLFNLLKSMLKIGILGYAAYAVIRRAFPEILALGTVGPREVLGVVRSLGLRLALMSGLVFLALALLDYGFQVWEYEKGLRMTKSDIMREYKETEGDPMVKSRIRSLQRSMARKRMLGKVATADVVVTNPTHLAVALKYDPLVALAPIVVAMGERLLAERIKKIAFGAGIPVVENKPLAQALFATAKVGAVIPPALYVAVAEIIAFVFRRKGSAPARGTVSRRSKGTQ